MDGHSEQHFGSRCRWCKCRQAGTRVRECEPADRAEGNLTWLLEKKGERERVGFTGVDAAELRGGAR